MTWRLLSSVRQKDSHILWLVWRSGAVKVRIDTKNLRVLNPGLD
jgi:hypothetical protein